MDDAEPLASLLHERGHLVVDRLFSGELPHDADMADLELEGCSLQVCRWQGQQVVGATFAECEFVDCDLSGACVERVTFRECSFRGTKALGVDWAAASVSTMAAVPMTWHDCTLDLSTFSALTMAGWTFRGCSLREIQLVGADLRRTAFIDCDLSGAAITDCDLRGATLIDCVGVALDARKNRVSGLQVSASMTADLVRPFGVVVR